MNDLHYALLLGINRYPGISDLSYARTDAQAVREWLLSGDGGQVPEENVVLIAATDQEERTFNGVLTARPKRNEVDLALREINHKVQDRIAHNGDDWDKTRLYVYVSGHGIAPTMSQGAVLMADAEPDVPGECIELARYGEWYEACGVFHELVLLADCCRERIAGSPPGTAPPFRLCSRPFGRTTKIVGYATGLAEYAYEPQTPQNPNDQRGFFTKALLDGLGGAAAIDPEVGGITSETLGVYVTKAVEELTREQPTPQRAQMVVEAGTSILLRAVKAAQRPRWQVTIALPAGFSGDVELRRGDRSVVETHTAAATPWLVELEEGLYGVFTVTGEGAPKFANDGLFQVLGGDTNVQL